MRSLRKALARQWRAWRQGVNEGSHDGAAEAPRRQDRAEFWAEFREGQRLAEKTCSEAAGVAPPNA